MHQGSIHGATLLHTTCKNVACNFVAYNPRITWVKDWIKNRESQGAFHQLMKEISFIDTLSYRNFVRIDATTFEELLTMISPRIHRQDTVMRKAICPGERLAITLRFLATGKYIQYIKIVL